VDTTCEPESYRKSPINRINITSMQKPAQRGVSQQLEWLSGISLTIGGAVATAAWLLHAVVDPERGGYAEPWWIPLNLSLSIGAILMALGLPGFHARQASATGVRGLIGLVLLFVGLLLAYVGVQTLEAFSRPDIPANIAILAGIAAPTFFLGIVITSVATWRAGVYPRSVAVALGVGAMLGLLTRIAAMPPWLEMNVMPAFFTAAMAWAGLSVVSRSVERRH
jgi:hypothetical protein